MKGVSLPQSFDLLIFLPSNLWTFIVRNLSYKDLELFNTVSCEWSRITRHVSIDFFEGLHLSCGRDVRAANKTRTQRMYILTYIVFKTHLFLGYRFLTDIAGWYGSSSLLESGSAYFWGSFSEVPTKISLLPYESFTSVSLGDAHYVALAKSGRIFIWGRSGDVVNETECRLNGDHSTRWISSLANYRCVLASAGEFHTCTVTSEGLLVTFGKGDEGQLGHGEHLKVVSVPRVVSALVGRRIVAVSAGRYHSGACDGNGHVFMWGNGTSGQLGNGSFANRYLPVQVSWFEDNHVNCVEISVGDGHTTVLSDEGSVFAFGWGWYGALGLGNRDNSAYPQKCKNLNSEFVVCVSSRGAHSACVTLSGKLYSWGRGQNGRLGHECAPNSDPEDELIPKVVDALLGVRVVLVSAKRHTLAVSEDGRIYVFGGDHDANHHICLDLHEEPIRDENDDDRTIGLTSSAVSISTQRAVGIRPSWRPAALKDPSVVAAEDRSSSANRKRSKKAKKRRR